MRCKPTTFWCALAAALPILVFGAGLSAAPQEPTAETQSGDEEDGQPPDGMPAEDPAAEEHYAAKPLGDSRRPDPFDIIDEPLKSAQPDRPAAARSDDDAVVCEAGCDGPKGTIVYKKKRPAG